MSCNKIVLLSNVNFAEQIEHLLDSFHLPAKFLELEVTETDPGLKGDTAQGGTKPATLSTGATIKGVPLFVNIGDVLKIDTRTGEYVNRVR